MASVTVSPGFVSSLDDNDDSAFANEPTDARPWRSAVLAWMVQDSPFIVMLALAFIGVILRLSVGYWLILTPVFGIICTIAGWRHFETNRARVQMALTQALNWFALIFAIYVLFNDVVKGEMNSNATSLAMMTLLALGTFTAGLQARVWRICAVGVVLFVAVPAMGFLDQSAVILTTAVLAILGIGGLVWWLEKRREENTVVAT